MNPRYAYKQLGFTDEGIKQVLARIKASHDKSAAQPDYMNRVNEVKAANSKMQKAASQLSDVLASLPVSMKSNMLQPPQEFTDYLALLQDGMQINVGAGPDQPKPSQKTIAKNGFIKSVAIEYRQQTDKAPGISNYGPHRSGEFIEFLLAVADDLGIDAKGLAKQAHNLLSRGRL
jgi:hypothetical protein